MTSRNASKLGLKICYTNVKAQKIGSFTLKLFEIILASFQIEKKLRKAYFFQKTFVLADISVKVVLGMLFPTFSKCKYLISRKKTNLEVL